MIGQITTNTANGVTFNEAPNDREYFVLVYTNRGVLLALEHGSNYVGSVHNIFACTEREEMQSYIDDNEIFLEGESVSTKPIIESFFGVSE